MGGVEVTYLCDTSWPKISPGFIPYYAAEDVVDTRHSNHSGAPVYLRPGAQRNAARMLEEVERREESARSDIRHAEWQLKSMAEVREKIASGKLDEVYL